MKTSDVGHDKLQSPHGGGDYLSQLRLTSPLADALKLHTAVTVTARSLAFQRLRGIRIESVRYTVRQRGGVTGGVAW